MVLFNTVIGYVGTNVGSYFVLVQWVFGLNVVIFLIMSIFVILPQVGIVFYSTKNVPSYYVHNALKLHVHLYPHCVYFGSS